MVIKSPEPPYGNEKCSSNLTHIRARNVIIHGLQEDEITDEDKIREVFAATNTQQSPMHMYRLGPRKPERNRPLLLCMKSAQEKEIFMSKLWMLKNFKRNVNLSVTNDYTLDERKIIRNCVEEAKKRNMKGVKGFLWKVRGTPREGMRIVKIYKE